MWQVHKITRTPYALVPRNGSSKPTLYQCPIRARVRGVDSSPEPAPPNPRLGIVPTERSPQNDGGVYSPHAWGWPGNLSVGETFASERRDSGAAGPRGE